MRHDCHAKCVANNYFFFNLSNLILPIYRFMHKITGKLKPRFTQKWKTEEIKLSKC